MMEFKSLQNKVQGALIATTRAVNGLGNEDMSFHRILDPHIGAKLDEKTNRLLKLTNRLLRAASHGKNMPLLDDLDDIDIQWKAIVDELEVKLENADTKLDEYTGLLKRKDAPALDAGRTLKQYQSSNGLLNWSLKRADIPKPQEAFERKLNNFDLGPWKPLLTAKPHATVSLESSIGLFEDEEGNQQNKHPYETEILYMKYPPSVYEKREPITYQPIELRSATWVDTYEGVLEMLEELKQAKEIAVDLEHHDYRTYIGLLSLMQISTRDKDWIVDTLQPWRHKLEVLNIVFADPSVLKVFHGAHMDIVWLQRDLGLYVVGLFDTFFASDILAYERKSLAYLLKRFVDFDADKKYQLADWRIRPLNNEMLYYARCDTHYLLYIYDMLRNELFDGSDRKNPKKDLIQWVVDKSKEASLSRYENPTYDTESGHGTRGWLNMVTTTSSFNYNAEQFAVFKAMHRWRDDMARKKDESPFYFMTNETLRKIAEVIPPDQKVLFSLLGNQSRLLKSSLSDMIAVIQEAKAAGANGGVSLSEFLRKNMHEMNSKHAMQDTNTSMQKLGEVVPSAQDLRAERSQLWGDMPLSSAWEDVVVRNQSKADMENKIALPWVQYALPGTMYLTDAPINPVVEENSEAREFETEGKVQSETPQNDSVNEMNVEELENEEFTLRKKNGEGKKRKRQADEPVGEQAEVSVFQSKKEKREKREKKEEKKKKCKPPGSQIKEAGPNDEAQDDGSEEAEMPFDYSTAQSVLHASKTGDEGVRKGGQKVFDASAKKLKEDIKGAKNLNYEKRGKSMTFK